MHKRFLPGIDVLLSRHKDWLKGRRVGLVSHLAAVDSKGVTAAERLWNEPGIRLTALFGPEHGFFAAAAPGRRVSGRKHPYWRIPVFSLYGAARAPTGRMLSHVDIIVTDLQDIAARPYTYVSTLRYVLESAARAGKPVVVADRPAPLPNTVDGPALEPEFESFAGCVRTPMLYGMTSGETAGWLAADLELNLDLRVAPIRGYARNHARGHDWPPWIPPSPGIQSWECAACYTATLFTEALPAIDCARGSGLAFRVFGAPWMRSGPICDDLARMRLPGTAFHSHPYTPAAGRFAGTMLDGVRIAVRDPDAFRPVLTGVAIISCIQERYGSAKLWNDREARPDWFDKLYGTDKVRKALARREAPTEIGRQWKHGLRSFKAGRRNFLIYGRD